MLRSNLIESNWKKKKEVTKKITKHQLKKENKNMKKSI